VTHRAWVVAGIALRYALALGLHLRNEDQTVEIVRKERLAQTWWALQTFEGSLNMMLGRPSPVAEDYCSTPLPLPVSMEQSPMENMAFYWNNRGRGGKFYDDNAAGFDLPFPELYGTGSLLRCLVNITNIGQRAMTGLYSARITNKSWKDVQGTIAGLCNELDFTQPNNGGGFTRERLIVQISYLGLRY
jgi:hypothetical protein